MPYLQVVASDLLELPAVGAVQITNRSHQFRVEDMKPRTVVTPGPIETAVDNSTSLVNITEFDYKELLVDVVFGVLIALLLLHLILNIARLIYVKHLKKRIHGSSGCVSSLWLELSDNNKCITLKILEIPACPSNLNVATLTPPQALTFLPGCIAGKVTFVWEQNKLIRGTDGRNFILPNKIHVDFMTQRRLRKVLVNRYTAHLVISHGTLAFPLTFDTLPRMP